MQIFIEDLMDVIWHHEYHVLFDSDILIEIYWYRLDWKFIYIKISFSKMQLQIKPRLYADYNKQMDEAYYNYEAYEIEFG